MTQLQGVRFYNLLLLGAYFFLLAAGPLVLFQSSAFSDGLPRIVISEPSFNFGEVAQGDRVRHSFKVLNKGTADLHISKVVAACGCTATVLDSDTIAPGQTGLLQVEFDSTGFSGEKLKTIRLFTNDPLESIAMVSLQGFIEPDIFIEPKRVLFGEVVQSELADDSYAREVTVRVREGKRAQIGALQVTGEGVKIEELERTERLLRFKVILEESLSPGELRRRIVVGLKGAERRAVNIPVFASVQGALRIQPPTLGFGVLEGVEPISRRVKLESLTGDKLSIVSITSKHPAVSAKEIQNRGSAFHSIEVIVDPKKVKRDLRASITVVTTHPNQREVVLSVYGILPPSL